MTMPSGPYVVTPRMRMGGPRHLWRRRGLLLSLTLKEVQVRYRQAALGVAWALLQPLALMAVCTLVFHGFLDVSSGSVPYPLFVFTGLVPWTCFQTAVSNGVPSLVSNAELVRKIYFPREALPLAHVAAALLDLAAGSLLGAVLALAWGAPVTAWWLLLPLLFAILVAAAAALALLGAAVNVYLRDVKHALPLLLQVVFFATPVVYPLDAVPAAWRPAFAFNPLTAVVEGLRRVVLGGRAPDAILTLVGAAVAAVALAAAWAAFRRAERRFADVV